MKKVLIAGLITALLSGNALATYHVPDQQAMQISENAQMLRSFGKNDRWNGYDQYTEENKYLPQCRGCYKPKPKPEPCEIKQIRLDGPLILNGKTTWSPDNRAHLQITNNTNRNLQFRLNSLSPTAPVSVTSRPKLAWTDQGATSTEYKENEPFNIPPGVWDMYFEVHMNTMNPNEIPPAGRYFQRVDYYCW